MIRGAQMSNRSHATCQEGKGEGRERKKVLAWPIQRTYGPLFVWRFLRFGHAIGRSVLFVSVLSIFLLFASARRAAPRHPCLQNGQMGTQSGRGQKSSERK